MDKSVDHTSVCSFSWGGYSTVLCRWHILCPHFREALASGYRWSQLGCPERKGEEVTGRKKSHVFPCVIVSSSPELWTSEDWTQSGVFILVSAKPSRMVVVKKEPGDYSQKTGRPYVWSSQSQRSGSVGLTPLLATCWLCGLWALVCPSVKQSCAALQGGHEDWMRPGT